MNKELLENYSFQNDIWKIFKISLDDSILFFEKSNRNNVNETVLNLPTCEDGVLNTVTPTNKILYSMMNDNDIEFLNPYDNEFHKTYNISWNYLDCPIVLYFCNINNPFIVVQTSEWMDFYILLYPNKKEILFFSKSGRCQRRLLIDILNTLYHTINSPPVEPITKFRKYLFFGFNMNIGHYLWQEVSGLYFFLQNKDYHNKIDGIIIGPYDAFNLESSLRKNYNFNIQKFTDIHSHCRHLWIRDLVDIFPIFLNSFYIDSNVKNLIEASDDNVITPICNNKKNILEITIDIRTYRRYLIDQDIFYTKLIKKILHDYKKYTIKINLIGCFQTHSNTIKINTIDSDTKSEYDKQIIIVNKIINNFKTNIKNNKIIFKNLIGDYFYSIKSKVINSKIFIAVLGTTMSNLINWIYNTKYIGFGPSSTYNWSAAQYNVLKNYDGIYSPIEFITAGEDIQSPFNINFDLYYDFFKIKLDELI